MDEAMAEVSQTKKRREPCSVQRSLARDAVERSAQHFTVNSSAARG